MHNQKFLQQQSCLWSIRLISNFYFAIFLLQEEKKPNIVAKVLAIFEQAICTKLLYASDIGYYEMQACFLACSLFSSFSKENSSQQETKLTISNWPSFSTKQGKTMVLPEWAFMLVLFSVLNTSFSLGFAFLGKNWLTLLNNLLLSNVPSLFMNKCVNSTGVEIAVVEVTLRPSSVNPVVDW